MLDLLELAGKKAEESRSPQSDWVSALERHLPDLKAAIKEEGSIALVVASCASLSQLTLISKALSHHSGTSSLSSNRFEELVRRVDESPYTLSEWIAAWETFNVWLERNNRRSDFLNALGYLDCCVEYIRPAPFQPTFPELVATMLDEYGYEG